VTQGLLSFWMTWKLLRRGKDYLAFMQPMLGYFGMFLILVHGWDGRGYQRFFSEDRATFETWTPAHITTWLTSDVALTLGVMGLVLIPVMLSMMLKWGREGYRMAGIPRRSQAPAPRYLALMLSMIFGVVLGSAVLASVLMHTLGTAVGAAGFVAIGAFAIVGRKGLLHWYYTQLDMDVRAKRHSERPGAPVTDVVRA
jgi:hypothetical protein